MTLAAEQGAQLMPFMPAFYQKPVTIDDLVDHWVGRVLDSLGLEHDIGSRYQGPPRPARTGGLPSIGPQPEPDGYRMRNLEIH
jgi:hypothetical protein